jgi:hypothetical protein
MTLEAIARGVRELKGEAARLLPRTSQARGVIGLMSDTPSPSELVTVLLMLRRERGRMAFEELAK